MQIWKGAHYTPTRRIGEHLLDDRALPVVSALTRITRIPPKDFPLFDRAIFKPRSTHESASSGRPPAFVYFCNGHAVFGFKLGLIAKRYVGVDIALGCEKRLQYSAPLPAGVSRRVIILTILS